MYFNSPDKSDSIIADIDFLLFGDGSVFNTDYSLDDRTRNVNIALDDVVSELFKADPNFKWDDTTNPDFPISVMDLIAGQDHYVIPDSTLVIHRVRIKGTNGEYMTLQPKNRAVISDSDLNTSGVPHSYFKIDNAIFPVPAPSYGASDGIEMEFQRGANHFKTTDTTKKPGFNPQFHQYLSISASLRYALANNMTDKASFLQGEKERIRLKIVEHYQSRSQDERPKLSLAKQNVKRYAL